MRMSVLLPFVIGVVAGTVGCQTAPSASAARPATAAAPQKPSVAVVKPVSMVGQEIGEVLAAARRQSVEVVFFTADGERSDTQPAEGGSVSVFTVAKNGQDNYTFDDAGRVTRHQRSVGENFARGVWEEVR